MLAYVEAVRRQGYPLRIPEFTAYANQWDQKITYAGVDTELMRAMEQMKSMASMAFIGNGRRQVEPMIDYLVRVKWLSKEEGRVDITALGKAVLREANAPLPDSDVGSTLEVVIDPADPFAYAQLMSKITGFDSCMIVDPYLDGEQLMTLAGFGSVTRILTGDRKLGKLKPLFGILVDKAPHLDVRWMEQSTLHDRYAIPGHGHVYMLGSSLNTIAKRFGVATTFEPSTSKLISEQYDALWEKAQPLLNEEEVALARPSVADLSPAVTAATVDDGTGS